MRTEKQLTHTLDFGQITLNDVARVGGKNASLGELYNSLRAAGVGVLDGFATTADAYRSLLAQGQGFRKGGPRCPPAFVRVVS